MRVLLCSAAVAVALAVAGCGSDSDSSSSSNGQTTRRSQRPQVVLHYITREAKPRNPGPHPNARVERLIVREIRRGRGPAIKVGDRGIFEFISSNWVTGEKLEESWHRRRPFETQIEKNVVIDGWWQAIPGMRVGGRRQIVIPPALGFTTNPLLLGATTYFDVVLVEIRPQRPLGLGGDRAPNPNAIPQVSAE
ncbi:MAG TPA: FKBP-type peptidyl-prolyl cis-trans isomerase [Conexibacter sp.]|nr:FKBP-type peptidyl-prolyl cis-trans isomerase [Conexibacter sp.]